MSNEIAEKKLLEQLGLPDFRHMTKDKFMSFASLSKDVDPEVAKAAISQFPEFAKLSLEALTDSNEVLKKTLDENTESSKRVFYIQDQLIESLKGCLDKEDITFEEKKYYIDKMMDVAKMADKKDSENKHFNWKIASTAGIAVVAVLGVGIAALGGKVDFNA